jgi:hypothetical protein
MDRDAAVRAMAAWDTVREYHKRNNGEIFTPIPLAERMLDALPAAFWSNRLARVLDPAAGFGVFPVLAFFRFMDGLKHDFPDQLARRAHIVSNILCAVEIDQGNARRCADLLLRLAPGATPQVHNADFLAWSSLPGQGPFDLVMGNPPYNAKGLGIGGALWVDFVRASLALVDRRGRLLFVHPPGWRKPAGKYRSAGDIWQAYRTQGSLVRLHVQNSRRPPFPEVDWYLWQRGRRADSKTSASFDGTAPAYLTLSRTPFLPGIINATTLGILTKVVGTPGYAFVRDNRFRFPPSRAKGTVPHAHFWDESIGSYRTLGLTPKQVQAMTGLADPPFYSASKVVMSMNASNRPGRLYPTHYPEGHRIGVTTNVMYQVMPPRKAAACVRFFMSDLVATVMLICQYSAPPNRKNEPNLVNALRTPDAEATRSEKRLHDFYGLTLAERGFVAAVARDNSVTF